VACRTSASCVTLVHRVSRVAWEETSFPNSWFIADFEGGVWAGGSGASSAANTNSPSMKIRFAFCMLKTAPGNYAIRGGNGQSGTLTTAYDGATPWAMDNQGGITLGVGSDNSNNSWGTFFEGPITAGRQPHSVRPSSVP